MAEGGNKKKKNCLFVQEKKIICSLKICLSNSFNWGNSPVKYYRNKFLQSISAKDMSVYVKLLYSVW